MFFTVAVYPPFPTVFSVFFPFGVLGGKTIYIFPRIEVGGLSSTLSDLII